MRIDCDFAHWQIPLIRDKYKYKVLYGGRGGGKSYAVAESLILLSLKSKCVILCGREFQNSIKQSVHSLIKIQITKLGLERYFTIKRDEIVCNYSGAVFVFYGFNRNIDAIKSIPDIKYLWIEEAAKVKFESWDVIDATVRDNDSEIWITFNPEYVDDIIYKTFILNTPPDTYKVKLTFRDNLHLDKSLALVEKANSLMLKDYDKYLHVYEGNCKTMSDAVIFKGYYKIEKFEEPEDVTKYFGVDWGFSISPTAGIRCYIHEEYIYITHEAVKLNLDLDETGKFLEKHLPNLKKHTINADNARPESISYLKRKGYSIKAVEKGQGSIEDGIEYLKSFERIIIHPRCVHTIDNFTKYTYQVNPRSGELLRKPEDANNDLIDALRYALESCMKRTRRSYNDINFEKYGVNF